MKKFYTIPKAEGCKFEALTLRINKQTKENVDIHVEDNVDHYFRDHYMLNKQHDFTSFINEHPSDKYFVIGDYDADGICGTTIMVHGLRLLGVNVVGFTCPDRLKDGYGMKDVHIDKAIEAGATVIVTVDNGISTYGPIRYAKSKGLKVIVTDHHLPSPGDTNEADIIIDPHVNGDEFNHISGATVAFKLVLNAMITNDKWDDSLYDLAHLAAVTVASDVMPVIGENKLLLQALFNDFNDFEGFMLIREMAYAFGMHKFCSTEFKHFNKATLDFYFVPFINALNRMEGNVNPLVEDMLITLKNNGYIDSMGRPCQFPDNYRLINAKRKEYKDLMNSLYQDDEREVALNPIKCDKCLTGISGLVSSTVTEKYHKPAFIGYDKVEDVNKETLDDMLHFSGRTVPGYSIHTLLTQIKNEHPDLNFSFGGHHEALGLQCSRGDLPTLYDLLCEKYKDTAKDHIVYYFAFKFQKDEMAAFSKFFYKYYPFGNKFNLPNFFTDVDTRRLTFDRNTLWIDDVKVVIFDSEMREDVRVKRNYFKQMRFGLRIDMNEHGKIQYVLSELIAWQ